MIEGAPFPVSEEWGAGLAATNAMAIGGIKSGDNLLAVVSIHDTSGLVIPRAVSDFTVADGSITAGTIDLSSTKFVAVWTSAPAA